MKSTLYYLTVRWAALLGLLFLAVPSLPALAQGYINQTAIEDVLSIRAESLDDVPEVYYEYFVFEDSRGNNVLARNNFYKVIGQGDPKLGERRAKVVELLNRTLTPTVNIGDTLVIPHQYEVDFRAYSPFPRYYPGAREFDKLFIIHKTIQAFAAYEHGQLVRWGIVNTGDPAQAATPNGRYNFNWKEEYRVSTLSPPDELWEMYWVVNFHAERGIHIHQYEMPTGGPTSHGCVRLVDADAKWAYFWVDGWKTTSKNAGFASSTAKILQPGTTVLVLGEEPSGKPQPFLFKKRYPVLQRIELPAHPYDIPPGTPQQEHFDRLRASSSASR